MFLLLLLTKLLLLGDSYLLRNVTCINLRSPRYQGTQSTFCLKKGILAELSYTGICFRSSRKFAHSHQGAGFNYAISIMTHFWFRNRQDMFLCVCVCVCVCMCVYCTCHGTMDFFHGTMKKSHGTMQSRRP